MAIKNHKHLNFILQMAKNGGDPIKAYRTAYPTCKDNKIAATNSGRLLKNAEIKKAVNDKLKEIEALASANVAQALSEETVGIVLSFNQKRQILAEIASGKARVARQISVEEKGKQILKDVYILPSNNDVVKAIELDNRMTGDFAADRREINLNTGTKTVDQLSDDQFNQLIDKFNTEYLKILQANGKN